MKNLWDTLQTDVSKIFKPKSTSTDPDQQFCRLAAGGRVIRSYSGFLPYCRRTAGHLLRCEHLRYISSEGLQPYCVQSNFTHQIWLWYRLNREPDKLHLLFRGQFDFTLLGRDSDWVAGEVADFLAFLLLNCEGHHREIFRHSGGEIFWAYAVERKFTSLLCELNG